MDVSLPYYGVTKDKIINGRYAAGREEAKNVKILGVSDYYTIKGAETAIIQLNSDGNVSRSTRIDNEIISTKDPQRVEAGKLLLNTEQPGWQQNEKQPQNNNSNIKTGK